MRQILCVVLRLSALGALAAGPAVAIEQQPSTPPGQSCADWIGDSRLQRVDFMVFFKDDRAALAAALEIDQEQFELQVRPAVIGTDWVLIARYREIPDRAELQRGTTAMQAIFARHGKPLAGPNCSWYERSRRTAAR